MAGKYTIIGILLCSLSGLAQEHPVKIVAEDLNQRIMLYAVNESDTDYDVKVIVSGTNFRQSRAAPRFIRVPAATRVFIQTLIPIRGHKATYTYKLELSDSLSNRALVREFKRIKVQPPRPIIIYYPEICGGCDSLVAAMENSKYRFTLLYLAEKPEVKKQLEQVFGGQSLDSLPLPIVNLGGTLYTALENYGQLLKYLEEP